MQKFITRIHNDIREYEICDYPYRDPWQYLKITRYHKGKYCGEESVDLSEINPEFFEVRCEKLPIVPLILAWAGIAFFAGGCTVMVLSLIFDKELISAASGLLVPLAVGVYSLNYIIQRKKSDTVSSFVFSDEELSVFEIPYMRKNRAEAYAIAKKIAPFCNQALCDDNELPVITHQFANGLAELRDFEVVLFNDAGVKCSSCNYISVVPGVYHHRESHFIRNFFCILTATLFWFGTLIFIIGSALTLKEWEMVFGFSIVYVIPFVLGHFFFSKCRKSQDFYFAGCRSEDSPDAGIYLETGKNPGSEKDFIAELNRRLRKAHEENGKQSNRRRLKCVGKIF